MMLTMTPAAFAADGDAVPAAAATALPEAEDGVITLTGSVNLTETQVFDTNTTIDLNGFDITATNCRALWQKSGTLTLTGKGTVRANKVGDTDWLSSSSVIRVGDGSDYTVESSSETAAGIVIDDEVTVSSTYCYGLSVFGGATKEIADISGTISAPQCHRHQRHGCEDRPHHYAGENRQGDCQRGLRHVSARGGYLQHCRYG